MGKNEQENWVKEFYEVVWNPQTNKISCGDTLICHGESVELHQVCTFGDGDSIEVQPIDECKGRITVHYNHGLVNIYGVNPSLPLFGAHSIVVKNPDTDFEIMHETEDCHEALKHSKELVEEWRENGRDSKIGVYVRLSSLDEQLKLELVGGS